MRKLSVVTLWKSTSESGALFEQALLSLGHLLDRKRFPVKEPRQRVVLVARIGLRARQPRWRERPRRGPQGTLAVPQDRARPKEPAQQPPATQRVAGICVAALVAAQLPPPRPAAAQVAARWTARHSDSWAS